MSRSPFARPSLGDVLRALSLTAVVAAVAAVPLLLQGWWVVGYGVVVVWGLVFGALRMQR